MTQRPLGATNTPEQLDATFAGAELTLDEDLKRACDEVWWRLPRRPVADGYR